VNIATTTTTAHKTMPRPTASVKPDCNPSYTLDKNGEKHFKPECY
jgi:hypothetical protein